jgi:hypothetical protein
LLHLIVPMKWNWDSLNYLLVLINVAPISLEERTKCIKKDINHTRAEGTLEDVETGAQI